MARPKSVDVFLTEKELADGLEAKKTSCLKVEESLLQPTGCVSKAGISSRKMFGNHSRPQSASAAGSQRPASAGPRPGSATQPGMEKLYNMFYAPSPTQSPWQGSFSGGPSFSGASDSRGGVNGSGPSASGHSLTNSKLAASLMAKHGNIKPQVLDDARSLESQLRTPSMLGANYNSNYSSAPVGVGGGSSLGSAYAASSSGARPTVPDNNITLIGSQKRPKSAQATLVSTVVRPMSAAPVMARGSAQGYAHRVSTASGLPLNAQRSVAAMSTATGRISTAGNGRPGSRAAGSSSGVGATSRSPSRNTMAHNNGGGGDQDTENSEDEDTAAAKRRNRPGSAAFRTTTRDQAQKIGSKFVYAGGDSPGPGKYNPRYGAMDREAHAPDIAKTPGWEATEGSTAACIARRQAEEASRAAAAASKPTRLKHSRSPSPQHAGQGQGQQGQPGQPGQQAGSGGAEHPVDPMFADAHRVHPKAPTPVGTVAFKAPPRPSPSLETTAGHLMGTYFREDYDKITRKSARPSSAFSHQIPRPSPANVTEAGEALGPGAYMPDSNGPATWTGRHVTSGHSNLAQTRDWDRATARPDPSAPMGAPQTAFVRPGSAPRERPPPSTAMQPGYWGPEGPTSSMWPNEPQYSDLVAVRALQERIAADYAANHPGGPGAGSTGHGAHGAAGVGAAAGASGSGDGAGGPPLTYLDIHALQAFNSSGLAKRVQGGAFSQTTRDDIIRGLRLLADGKVIPPAAVKVLPGVDLMYDPNWMAQSHRRRDPSVTLPPNRTALSRKWVETAATAYL